MNLDTLYHLDGEAVTPSPYELIDFPGIQPGSQPCNNFGCEHQNCMQAGDRKQLYYKSVASH